MILINLAVSTRKRANKIGPTISKAGGDFYTFRQQEIGKVISKRSRINFHLGVTQFKHFCDHNMRTN